VDPGSIGAAKGRGFAVKARQFAPDAGGPAQYVPNWAATQPSTRAFQYRPRVEPRAPADATPGPGST
jgi:hypothetical protein